MCFVESCCSIKSMRSSYSMVSSNGIGFVTAIC